MKYYKTIAGLLLILLFTSCEKDNETKSIFDSDAIDVWIDCTDGRGNTTDVGVIAKEGVDLYSTFVNPQGDSKGYAKLTYPFSGSYGYLLTKSGGGSFQVYNENMDNVLFELETGKAIFDENTAEGTTRIVRCKRGSRLDEFEIKIRLQQE